jgi:hypothetical protein
MQRATPLEVEIAEPNVVEDAEEVRVGFTDWADGNEGGPATARVTLAVASPVLEPTLVHGSSSGQYPAFVLGFSTGVNVSGRTTGLRL